jgi:tetratricopeptide (TPR) repeat protein
MAAAALLAAACLLRVAARPGWKAVGLRMFCGILVAGLAALTFLRARDWRDDEHLWRAALRTHPQSVRARTGLSGVYRDRGDWKKALSMAEEAVRLARPGTSLYRDAQYLAAWALDRAGRRQEAAERLRLALKGSANTEANAIRYQNLWSLEMRLGHYDRALHAAEALMRRQGETTENLLLLGLTLKQLGRLGEAREALEKGAAQSDAGADLHFALAELYDLMQEPDKARDERKAGEEIRASKDKESEP